MHELRVGDGVHVRGFFDCVYSPTDAPAHLVLLGGGTGIIPLVALALDALRDSVPVTLVVAHSAPDQRLLCTEVPRGLCHFC